jgi:hypothetical protein
MRVARRMHVLLRPAAELHVQAARQPLLLRLPDRQEKQRGRGVLHADAAS